jgi:hypothetical protein
MTSHDPPAPEKIDEKDGTGVHPLIEKNAIKDQPNCACSKWELIILWIFIAGMFIASVAAVFWLVVKLDIHSR